MEKVYNNNIKIANNTNINHIMVSITDHYNAISIDRLPSKTKIGTDSWYFNNSLLCKPKFSSATKNFLSLLETQKIATLQQVTGGNTPNLVLQRILRDFLKIPPIKKIFQFHDRICFFFSKKEQNNNHSSTRLVGKHQM